MPTELKLEKFEGPLDLLLQLIDQEKMDISEIALSKITEQFFAYLDKLEQNRPEELADFLVIAARLIYLKSHHLLQYANPSEETGPDLTDQLKLYKQYVEASKKINAMWQVGSVAYGRVEPPIKATEFIMPSNAAARNLHAAMTSIIRRLKPVDPLPKVTIDHSLSVKQKIDSIRHLLKNSKEFNFTHIVQTAKNKTEIIVSFLAILELIKEKTVSVKQDLAFDDMVIVRR